MALITAAQFREHFPQLTGTAADSVLDAVITRADAVLALFIGLPVPDAGSRTLEDTTYTRYLDGPSIRSPRALDLGVAPVVSITSANVDAGWDYGSSTAVAAGDMVLEGQAGRLWLRPDASSSWAEAPRANKVVCVAGFTSTPSDLALLTIATVRHLWDLRGSQGRQQRTAQSHSETYVDVTELIPASVRALLGPYILPESRVA